MRNSARRRRRTWPVLLLAGPAPALLLGPPSIGAQPPSPPPSFQEVLDVNLVNVDVVVVDKKGELVTDLGRDDFQIIDDSKKVEVEYFARLTGGVVNAAATTAGGGAPDRATAAEREAQHLIVFVDTDSQQLLNRNRVLDEISEYLASHAQDTTAMVVTYGGSGLDIKLRFSTSPVEWKTTIDAIKEMPSRGLLRAAEQRRMVESIKHIQRGADQQRSVAAARDDLDGLIGSVRTEAESMRMDGSATINAVQTLVGVLSTVPGPKSMLYVGDGVPIHPGEELYNLLSDVFESDRRFEQSGTAVASTSPTSDGVGTGDAPSGGGGAGGFTPPPLPMANSAQNLRLDALSLDLTPELRALTATANSHRVTIYGLSSDVQGGAARADMNLGSRAAGAALNYDVARSQVREQSLRFMAAETGGLSLPPGAGVTPFMERVLADDANRYSLAYVSPHGGDSRYHKIKVKVNRKGVELRHREGYIDRPRDVLVGDLVASALLLGWGENPHQLEMEVASQAPAENDEMAVIFSLYVPIDHLHLVPAGEQHEAKLDLYIMSKDVKGSLAPLRSVSLTVTLSPADLAQAKGKFYAANLPLSLAKGPHTVAVGVVEPAAQRTSVVTTEIEVAAAPSSAPEG